MDKFSALSAFVAVVEHGNFAAAARALGLSRSQVNRTVINLEDALAVHLFNRTTRAVALTPSGQAFYERVKSVLSDLSEAEQALRADHEEPQGEMRINAPMSFGIRYLGPALVRFMRRHPKVRVQLSLSDRFVDPVAEGFDMTLRIAEPSELPSLIEHAIVPVRRVICASPDFIAEYGEPQSLSALSALPCLHYGNLPTGNLWRLRREGASWEDVRVNGVLCANNAEVLRDAALSGLGLALLPTFVASEELADGRLRAVLKEYAAAPIALTLLYPPNRHLSARTRLFVKFMHEQFANLDEQGAVADGEAGPGH
ncbi:MAG: LysR substrate-binding domain-containing protein [Pseudomonadota bacterium]